MAWDAQSLTSPALPLRGQAGTLLSPEGVAGRIVNMELTEKGTLRSVRGPVEYHPATWEDNGGTVPAATDYKSAGTAPNGIFHCRTYGGVRDILLAAFNGSIWTHYPWTPGWNELIGTGVSPSNPDIATPMPEDDLRPAFLTQFEATPNGVVIVPQGGRAHFYDGELVAPLGFEEIPGPPTPMGPRLTVAYDTKASEEYDVANLGGYAHNTRLWDKTEESVEWETGAAPAVGTYRLGHILNDIISATGSEKLNNPLGGVMGSGEWRCAVQLHDVFGNLSPIGAMSAPVMVHREDNLVKERRKDTPETAERMRVQFGWGDLPLGNEYTVARSLLRTKDQRNTLLPGLWWVPPNATHGGNTFATLEDVAVDFYPDNIPDTWLLSKAKEVAPMPTFRLCKLAFGRMWFANMVGNSGLVQASYPGMWGTIDPQHDVYPDATGTSVTGMHAAQSGLLLFTEVSTFLVTPNDSGNGFVARTLSPAAGCVSPDSIKTLPNGLTVWLGREGFYAYDGEKISLISNNIKDDVIRRINPVWRLRACAAVDPRMGEYRCWIPVDGATSNNLCVVFDNNGWRERTDVTAVAGVCTTRDSRQYMLALGDVDTTTGDLTSVWLLDHEGQGTVTPSARDSIVETTWLRNASSRRVGSPTQVDIWLRETTSSSATIEVMRDWREYPLASGAGTNPTLYPDSDTPPFWDTAVYGSTYDNPMSDTTIPTHIVARRPFWTNLALSVPSCEVFKVRITYPGDFEFMALGYELSDKHGGGAKIPEGS